MVPPLSLGLDGQEHQVSHQSNRVALRPVFASFLVISVPIASALEMVGSWLRKVIALIANKECRRFEVLQHADSARYVGAERQFRPFTLEGMPDLAFRNQLGILTVFSEVMSIVGTFEEFIERLRRG